ncbi:MAG: lactate racemase domain-containing protein [Thermoflexales bacterium]|nr:lactate racemase domain-containing protein [Thermoflexales bacterium]
MDERPLPSLPEPPAAPPALPRGWRIDALEPGDGDRDEPISAERALATPVAALTVEELAGPGSRVAIACGAALNGSPDALILPVLLDALARAGVRAADIALLLAGGDRPGLSAADRAALAGRVGGLVDVPAAARADFVSLGAVDGITVRLHHRAFEADLLLATGGVLADEFAGYTGGADSVAVGCADPETRLALHSAAFLEQPATRSGNLTDNVYQRLLREVARRAGLLLVVNALLHPADGTALLVLAGAPAPTHDALARLAAARFSPQAPGDAYDVVVLADAPDDRRTLYHASRDIAAATLAPRAVLRPQGVIIAQGGGDEDPAAVAFERALTDATSAEMLLRQLRARGLAPGEERAYRLAQSLAAGAHVVMWQPDAPGRDPWSATLARSLAEAAELAEAWVGHRPRALLVPQGAGLLPVAGFGARDPGDGDDADNPFGAWADGAL